MASDSFFDERTAASEFKHAILGRYLKPFATKVTHRMAEPRVYYIDGYAGPGVYDNDSPGSPLVVSGVAGELLSMRRSCALHGVFVEEKRHSAAQLEQVLATSQLEDWRVLQGTAEDRLEEAIGLTGSSPLMVFLDPYGLGIPFDMLVDLVLARARHATTEVILNFSLSGLARLGGFLDKDWRAEDDEMSWLVGPQGAGRDYSRLERQRDTLLDRMDAFLGGTWWRDVKRANSGGDWRACVRDGFLRSLNERTDGKWLHHVTPVTHAWGRAPVYELVLLTRHHDGLWLFNEATAKTFHDQYERRWTTEQASLFDDAIMDPRSEYVERIKHNVIVALTQRGEFEVRRALDVIFCEATRGVAGPPEVLKALKALHAEGMIEGDPPRSRDLGRYRVTPGPRLGR